MNKKQIRNLIIEKLQTLSTADYENWSRKIADNLYNLDQWKQATTIGITISRGKEVDTRAIIQKGWEQGKRIVVPKCEPATKGMTFRVLESFDQLEVIFYGLEEPKESETMAVVPSEIDFLLVPGLAYDVRGYRVGFGGGYYDRFLTKYEGKTAILAFNMQILQDLPIEGHDIPVGMLITNEQVVTCK